MQTDYAQIRTGTAAVAEAIAAVRSARNLTSRKRAEEGVERVAEGARRRYKALKDRDAEAALKRRIRIKMADEDRPRTGSRTPRRLFHRMVERMLKGKKGSSSTRGADGLHAIHYSFTARGLTSRTGRRWRKGEAERAALYAVREDALEDGELGWWSNVAQDRNELVAHYRTLESLEKHDRTNANVYIVEVIALPVECTGRQRRRIVERLCRWFEERGLGYTVGIHLPDRAGDQRNHHLHLVYSTRPCLRIGPYEWDFAAAKQTDINSPAGIRNRRHAVVRAINATLEAAQIGKRYTPLSNHARGIAPPRRGKVGQAATWAARRLAAQEERRARLLRLGDQVRRLHLSLVEASARLTAARVRVERRCAEMTARIARGSDKATPMAALRDRVEATERRSGMVEAEFMVRAPGMENGTPHDQPDAHVASATKPTSDNPLTAARALAEERHLELCERALARLEARREAIGRDASGHLTVDMTALPAPEREALLRPAFATRLQDRLQAMLLNLAQMPHDGPSGTTTGSHEKRVVTPEVQPRGSAEIPEAGPQPVVAPPKPDTSLIAPRLDSPPDVSTVSAPTGTTPAAPRTSTASTPPRTRVNDVAREAALARVDNASTPNPPLSVKTSSKPGNADEVPVPRAAQRQGGAQAATGSDSKGRERMPLQQRHVATSSDAAADAVAPPPVSSTSVEPPVSPWPLDECADRANQRRRSKSEIEATVETEHDKHEDQRAQEIAERPGKLDRTGGLAAQAARLDKPAKAVTSVSPNEAERPFPVPKRGAER